MPRVTKNVKTCLINVDYRPDVSEPGVSFTKKLTKKTKKIKTNRTGSKFFIHSPILISYSYTQFRSQLSNRFDVGDITSRQRISHNPAVDNRFVCWCKAFLC